MSKFADAALGWMRQNNRAAVSADDLWNGLCAASPDLTEKTPCRKTPRNTCMRDLRKDSRFAVGKGLVRLTEP